MNKKELNKVALRLDELEREFFYYEDKAIETIKAKYKEPNPKIFYISQEWCGAKQWQIANEYAFLINLSSKYNNMTEWQAHEQLNFKYRVKKEI